MALVENKHPRIQGYYRLVTLNPGVNRVDDAVLAKVREVAKSDKYRFWSGDVKEGKIVVYEGAGELQRLKMHEAIDLVEATFDAQLLKEFAQDQRPKVAVAANDQLAKLKEDKDKATRRKASR